jgi:hypothetical protein
MPVKSPEKLGDILVKAGLIDEMQLRSALGHQRRWGGKLGKCLVDMGFLTEEAMLKFLAQASHMKAVDLTRSHIAPQTFKMVPEAVARKYEVVPVVAREVQGKKTIVLAMSDPSNLQAVDEIQFLTNARVEPVLATDSAIMRVLEHYGSYSPDMLHPKYGERHQEPESAAPAPSPKSPPAQAAPPPKAPQPSPPPLEEVEPITLDEGIDIEPDEEIEVIQGEITILKTKDEATKPKPPPEQHPPTIELHPVDQPQTSRPQRTLVDEERVNQFEITPEKDQVRPGVEYGSQHREPPPIGVDIGSSTERAPQRPPLDKKPGDVFFTPPEVGPPDQPPPSEPPLPVSTESLAYDIPQPEDDIQEIRPGLDMEITRGSDSVSEFQTPSHEVEQKEGIDLIDMPEDEGSSEIQLADAHEFIPQYSQQASSEFGVSKDTSGVVHPKLLEKQEVARADAHIQEEQEIEKQTPAQEMPEQEFAVPQIPFEESPRTETDQMTFEAPPSAESYPEQPQELKSEAPEMELPHFLNNQPGAAQEETPTQTQGTAHISKQTEPEQQHPPSGTTPLPEEQEPPSIFDQEPPPIDLLKPQHEREVVLPPPEGYEFAPRVKLPFEEPISTPPFEGDLVDRPDAPDFNAMPDKEMPDTGLSEQELFFNVQPRQPEPADQELWAGDLERVPAGRDDEESELSGVIARLEELAELDEDFLDSKTVRTQMEKILELETEVKRKEYQFDELLNLMMKKELGEITSEIFMKELTSLKLKIDEEKRKKRKK